MRAIISTCVPVARERAGATEEYFHEMFIIQAYEARALRAIALRAHAIQPKDKPLRSAWKMECRCESTIQNTTYKQSLGLSK